MHLILFYFFLQDIGEEFVEFQFTKNGSTLGDPVQIPKAEAEGKTWFPHVLVRNVKFSVNFGQTDPAYPASDGYLFAGKVEPSAARVRGPQRPAKREDCEVSKAETNQTKHLTNWPC